MAKITALPTTDEIDGTEHLPVVQRGATRRMTLATLRGAIVPFLQDWYKGDTGDTGPANSTYATRRALAETAPVTNASAIVVGDGTFTWRAGDLVALIAAEPANFIASLVPGAPAGAWIRVPGEGNFATLAALKLGRYVVGQTVSAAVYGNSRWVCRRDLVLQNHYADLPHQSSKVDFDDQLSLVVDLVDGGQGILDCIPESIQGHIANEVTRLYNVQFARFERKASLDSVATVAAFGDSITRGQGARPLPVGERVPTNFGDGSFHEWEQVEAPWPERLQSFLSQIHGPDKVTVLNLGFSQDCSGSAYRRHRKSTFGQTISLIGYASNDALFGSDNGIHPEALFDPANPFAFDRFTPTLRRFVYREVLRGSLPILIAPFVFASLQGYDGTVYAAGKIAATYRMAIRSLAEEIGAGFLDWSTIVNARDLLSQCPDGIHPIDACHLTIAARTASMLMGRGWRDRTDIYGNAKVMAIPHLENIAGPSDTAADDLRVTANVNSFGKPFMSAGTAGELVILAGEKRFIPFFCHVDEVALMPVGYVPPGATLNYALNFGDPQGPRRLNTRRGAAKGEVVPLPAARAVINNTPRTIDLNHAGQSRDHLVVQGRGWHILTLHAEGGDVPVSGVHFDQRMGEVGAAIADPIGGGDLSTPSGGSLSDDQARSAISDLIGVVQSQGASIVQILELLRDQARIAA